MAWRYENDQLNWTEPKLVSTSENESGKKIERERDAERKSPGVSKTTKTPERGRG